MLSKNPKPDLNLEKVRHFAVDNLRIPRTKKGFDWVGFKVQSIIIHYLFACEKNISETEISGLSYAAELMIFQ